MKLLVYGSRSFGAAALQAILRQTWLEPAGRMERPHATTHQVVAVVSPPTRGQGRHALQRDRLRVAADEAGIPWHRAGTPLDVIAPPADLDLIVCAHSHDFIGRRTRAAARLGAIGYHPSLLPRHRGRDAVRWTIRMRDPIAGGSVYWLTDNVDAGPIAHQGWCHVRPDDTPSTLWERELFPLGVKLLNHAVAELQRGIVRAQPQDEACATWEPALDQPPIHRPELHALPATTGTGHAVVPEAAQHHPIPAGAELHHDDPALDALLGTLICRSCGNTGITWQGHACACIRPAPSRATR